MLEFKEGENESEDSEMMFLKDKKVFKAIKDMVGISEFNIRVINSDNKDHLSEKKKEDLKKSHLSESRSSEILIKSPTPFQKESRFFQPILKPRKSSLNINTEKKFFDSLEISSNRNRKCLSSTKTPLKTTTRREEINISEHSQFESELEEKDLFEENQILEKLAQDVRKTVTEECFYLGLEWFQDDDEVKETGDEVLETENRRINTNT